MHRKKLSKSGQYTVKWNVIARGSEGWGTRRPRKRGITSQFTVFGQSQERAGTEKELSTQILTQKMRRFFIYS